MTLFLEAEGSSAQLAQRGLAQLAFFAVAPADAVTGLVALAALLPARALVALTPVPALPPLELRAVSPRSASAQEVSLLAALPAGAEAALVPAEWTRRREAVESVPPAVPAVLAMERPAPVA